MELIKQDDINEYRMYRSKLVIDNQQQFIDECHEAKTRFDVLFFPERSSTWLYRKYNMFSLTAGSVIFYNLFEEIKSLVREHANHDNPLWFQSWMNFHMPNEVLDWHKHHHSIFHGYVSILPHKTKTQFKNNLDFYELHNEVGNIYIGPSYKYHKVEVVENYQTPRITIAFDIFDSSLKSITKNNPALSIFPI